MAVGRAELLIQNMNHIYRLKRTGRTLQLQPVPEITRSAGKGQRRTGRTRGQVTGHVVASVALAGLVGLTHAQQAPPTATQLPQGGVVSRGSATISTSVGQGSAQMSVNQTSNRAVIDWTSFNLGANAKVQFNQPSSSAVVLNQVLGNNASQIYGQISANGQVFLSNPNGVYFSPTAQVNVGGLVATTGKANVDDFMAGKASFSRDGSSASVVNEGHLQAGQGGYIALLAPEVRNQGVVVAQAGTVALATGEAITLNFNNAGTGLVGLTTTPQAIAALVDNRSAVLAEGGQIILSAHALATLQNAVVSNSGQLSATSLVDKGGKIVLMGDTIALTPTSRIDANGPNGGGTVLVGGDWQGSGDTRQATRVMMEAGATIDASATDKGDGGKVVLWSDVHNADSQTTVAGSIQAEGKGVGTRGGQIETSGARLQIADSASIRMGGTGSKDGMWLLDPKDFTIASSGGDITGATLSAQITAGNTVEVLNTSGASGTAGNINVIDSLSWSNTGTLKLSADGGVTGTNAGNIAMTGGGTVIFNQTGASTYSGTISGTGSFTKDGAGVLKFTRSQTYTGATLISNGTLQMEIVASPNPSGNLAAASAVTNNATLSFNASAFTSSYSFGASVAGTGNLLVTGTANPYLAGTNTYSGTTTINAGATLNIGNSIGNGATGSLGTGAVVNNGSLTFARSGTVDVPNDISGSGTLTINGSSTNTFSGNNSFSGNVTTGQTVKVVLGSATAMGTGSTIFLGGSSVLRYTPSNTVDYSARISISGNSAPVIDTNGQDVTWANALSSTSLSALIKDGAGRLLISGGLILPGGSIITPVSTGLTVRGGTLVLGGANTIGNGITINAGATLQIGNAGTTGDLGGTTTVTNNGTLTFNRSNALSISNVINGTGDLVKAGVSALSLLGANGYTGNTTLSAGILSLDSSSALGYGGTISFQGGSLKFSTSNRADYSSRFSTAANQAYSLDTNGQSVTLGSALSSPGGTLTKLGTGTLTLAAANTYSGATTVSAGTLAVTHADGLGTSAADTTVASGATLDLQGVSVGNESIILNGGTLAASSGISSLGGTVAMGANATVNVGGTSLTLNGSVSGPYALTKSGGGTLVLAAANTYGSTVFSAGKLRLANNLALPDSSLSVAAGNTLELGALDGSNLNVTGKTLTLASSASFGGGGYLHNVAGANTWSDAITLQNNSTVTVDTGTSLNLSSASSTVAAGAMAILKVSDGDLTFGTLTGSGGAIYVKSGAGTLSGNFVGLTGKSLVYARPVDASNLNSSEYGSIPGYSLGFFSASTGGTQYNLVSGTDYSGTIVYSGAPTATSVPGSYTFSYTSGATLSNAAYYLAGAGASTTWTVAPKPLTITAATASKTYDGLAYSGGSVSYSAFANGQSASALTGTLTYGGSAQGAINAGSYTLTASGLSSSNYAITYVDGSLTIGKANLSKVAATKVYDGLSTVTATQMTAIEGVHGETFSATAGTANISDKNVAGIKTLTDLSSLTLSSANGGLSSNYNLSTGLPAAGNLNRVTIEALALQVTGVAAQNKTYDGTTTATLSGTAQVASLAGDAVTVDASGMAAQFVSTAVGTVVPVTVTGYALTGAAAGNYSLSQPTGLSADIVAAISNASSVPLLTPSVSIAGPASLPSVQPSESLVNLGARMTAVSEPSTSSTNAVPAASTAVAPDVDELPSTNERATNSRTTTQAATVTARPQAGERATGPQNPGVAPVPAGSGTLPTVPLTDVVPPVSAAALAVAAAPALSPSTTGGAGLPNAPAGTGTQVQVVLVKPASVQNEGVVNVRVAAEVVSSASSLVIPLAEHLDWRQLQSNEVSVKLPNGMNLPEWMQYQVTERALVARVIPPKALPLQVMVQLGDRRYLVDIRESDFSRVGAP